MFRLIASLADIPAEAWDALAPTQPFLRHAWLVALERHGCVGPGTGWQPLHATLWRDETLLAAAPAYLKSHSWGEYVFDWAWAEAYQRHGLAYYPKWLCAVPFTPVTGPRLLAHSPADRDALLQGMLGAAPQLGMSSLHILFPDQTLPPLGGELMRREGVQFHWHNQGFTDFDAFLAALSHDKRKKIRQERNKVARQDIVLRTVEGPQLKRQDWSLFHRCYSLTYAHHGAQPYLSEDFFQAVGQEMAQACVMVIASREGRDIACSLLMRDDEALYGRYWGALEYHPCLHFECCYYSPIEYAIGKGLQRFEGGAQGEHKLARGLDPAPTQSWHWIAEPRFREAIGHFLQRESAGMHHYIDELAEHSAYREK